MTYISKERKTLLKILSDIEQLYITVESENEEVAAIKRLIIQKLYPIE